jgi:beta-phosphoglucomutase family hydrolase
VSAPESKGDLVLGLPDDVHACLFDLDGVLTDTASVHTAAWAAMFDAYLRERADRTGQPFVPFDPAADYQRYVDGRPRPDGVRTFLASRGIELPEGHPDDPTAADTVHGLGNRKNAAFARTLRRDGARVFEGSRRYLAAAAAAGQLVAVVSSSANTRDVLAVTGLEKFVKVRVDGVTIQAEGLAGKPAPDSFLRAARLLGVEPARAAVFEDALSGVQAGRAGGFAIVVGVDRVGQAEALRAHGADVVVDDLADLLEQPGPPSGPTTSRSSSDP